MKSKRQKESKRPLFKGSGFRIKHRALLTVTGPWPAPSCGVVDNLILKVHELKAKPLSYCFLRGHSRGAHDPCLVIASLRRRGPTVLDSQSQLLVRWQRMSSQKTEFSRQKWIVRKPHRKREDRVVAVLILSFFLPTSVLLGRYSESDSTRASYPVVKQIRHWSHGTYNLLKDKW